MTRPLTARIRLGLAPALLALVGCAEPAGTDVETTPAEVVSPEAAPGGDPGVTAPADDEATEAIPAAAEPAAEPEAAVAPEPAAVAPEPAAAEPAPSAEPEAGDAASTPVVPADDELPAVTYDELLARVADGDAKLTLVDCWASWCDPCKENFPHVIEMAEAYGDSGLKAIALSFDAGTEVDEIDLAQIAEAKQFLAGHDVSKVENLRHGQLLGESFEAFGITTIPAVFLYDADGKEVARFTYDDPENQFTYDEVEARVAELLGVEARGVVPAEPAE